MNKKIKKIICLALALVMMLSSLQAVAVTTEVSPNYPLKISITTDRQGYNILEKVKFTVTIKNISSYPATNISAFSSFQDITPVDKSSILAINGVSLQGGQTLSYSYNAYIKKDKCNFFQRISLWFKMMFTSKCSIPAAPECNNRFVFTDSVEVKFSNVNVTESLTVYANFEIPELGPDNLDDDIVDRGDLQVMEENGDIDVLYGDNGSISSISGSVTDKEINNKRDACDLLNSMYPLFDGFGCSESDISIQQIPGEEVFYKVTPTVYGIPVIGNQIILSVDNNGKMTSLNSTYNSNLYNAYNEGFNYSEEEAINVVVKDFCSDKDVSDYIDTLATGGKNRDEALEEFAASLTFIIKRVIFAADDKTPYAAYAIDITNSSLARCTYYVSAADSYHGQITYREPYVRIDNVRVTATDVLGREKNISVQQNNGTYTATDSGRNISIYNLNGTESLPGTLYASNSLSRDVVSTMSNFESVYDFYYNVLGRKSFDDDGAEVVGSYNLGGTYSDNAYWSGYYQQFAFGKDAKYHAALDVVSHEYTHAVNSYISGFVYQSESGALDEAYADIMGAFAEGKTGDDFWNHAEDSGGVSRTMKNPASISIEGLPYPVHYSELSSSAWDSALDNFLYRDNEGVHIFCSVYYYAVYKMMTDSRTSGISKDTWANVFYRSLFRLSSDSTFLDGRGAVICSAKALGFNASQQQAIKDAFDAVGIVPKDNIRIVLTWGETPRDLDSHLFGPSVDGSGTFHTWFQNRNYYENDTIQSNVSLYAADLDYDDVTSYGPEVTTIYILTPGEYKFLVHDYTNYTASGSTGLARSGATVKVYINNSSTPNYTFRVNTQAVGTVWNVFTMNISNNGNISVNTINTYETYYPGDYV